MFCGKLFRMTFQNSFWWVLNPLLYLVELKFFKNSIMIRWQTEQKGGLQKVTLMQLTCFR